MSDIGKRVRMLRHLLYCYIYNNYIRVSTNFYDFVGNNGSNIYLEHSDCYVFSSYIRWNINALLWSLRRRRCAANKTADTRKKTLYNNNETRDETAIRVFSRRDIMIRATTPAGDLHQNYSSSERVSPCIPNDCKRNPLHRCNWHAQSEAQIKIEIISSYLITAGY